MTDVPERRAGARVERPFPVTVRGIDAIGERLDIDTVLENVSRGGLYVRIPRRVETGAQLALGFRFCEPSEKRPAARVATRGVVLRTDSKPGGDFGLAVGFTKFRIF